MPVISIIIPVYNAASYLHECIDSVLKQSMMDFELLLIDDGSKDASGMICDDYALYDKRVKVIHQKNRGVSVARNVGLDYAKGDYITFVDADDILLPHALSCLYNVAVSKNTDVVLASSNVLVNGTTLPYHLYKPIESENVINNMNHPALWGYMIRASVIRENHIRFVPGLAYSEDAVFLAELALKSKNIVHIPTIVYIYRKIDTAASATKDGVMSSGHQFHAAYMVDQLAIQEKDYFKRKFLIKKKKKLLRAGYYDFASLSFSLNNYSLYEKQYLSYFNGRLNLFFETIKARAIFIRRKIITINDNPLNGRKGIGNKIKSFWARKKII